MPIAANKVLKDFSSHISEVKCLQRIMQCVKSAHICPGNPQPEFDEILNKWSGSSADSKVAFVDSEVEVVDVDGSMYGWTVRRNDCELLCLPNTTHPKQSKMCTEYHSQLRVAKY